MTGVSGRRSRRAQLVEHAVLRHLEEPRRELAAEREPRQPLEDAQEDFLRHVLGEARSPREPEDVVEDRRLVLADDEREGPLVAALGFAQDRRIGLWERQEMPEYSPVARAEYHVRSYADALLAAFTRS